MLNIHIYYAMRNDPNVKDNTKYKVNILRAFNKGHPGYFQWLWITFTQNSMITLQEKKQETWTEWTALLANSYSVMHSITRRVPRKSINQSIVLT